MKKVILISSVFLSFLIAINCGHKKENKNGNEGMTVSILPVTPIPIPPDVDSTQPNNQTTINNEEQYQSYFDEHQTDSQESSLISNSETSNEISSSSETSNSEESKDLSSISTTTPTPTPTPTTIPIPKRTPRPKK